MYALAKLKDGFVFFYKIKTLIQCVAHTTYFKVYCTTLILQNVLHHTLCSYGHQPQWCMTDLCMIELRCLKIPVPFINE